MTCWHIGARNLEDQSFDVPSLHDSFSPPSVSAEYSGHNVLSLEISRIELKAPSPYVELRY